MMNKTSLVYCRKWRDPAGDGACRRTQMQEYYCPICSTSLQKWNGETVYEEGEVVLGTLSHIPRPIIYRISASYHCKACGVLYLLEHLSGKHVQTVYVPRRLLLPEVRLHIVHMLTNTEKPSIEVEMWMYRF